MSTAGASLVPAEDGVKVSAVYDFVSIRLDGSVRGEIDEEGAEINVEDSGKSTEG